MHLTISNDIVSTKNYDKHDDFDFEIIMVMFLALHPMESISLNSLIRASSHVADFNTRNKLLTQKLLEQGYQYHKLRKTLFLNFIDYTMI